MKTEKSVLPYRWALILFCAGVAGTCLYTVNRGYDPLARYPYADETQRETILAYMDQEDIDYLINQQLQPGVFMEFLTLPEFDVHNALWYRRWIRRTKIRKSWCISSTATGMSCR